MLPSAEIVFLDEIFKSNSAILNSLLTIINERKFTNGPQVLDVPLISMFAASNEVPNDDNLSAMFDRFLLRVLSDNLDSYHFHELLNKGVANEIRKMTGRDKLIHPVISATQLRGSSRKARFARSQLNQPEITEGWCPRASRATSTTRVADSPACGISPATSWPSAATRCSRPECSTSEP